MRSEQKHYPKRWSGVFNAPRSDPTQNWCHFKHTQQPSFKAWPDNYSDRSSLGKTDLTMCAFMKCFDFKCKWPVATDSTKCLLRISSAGSLHFAPDALIKNTGERCPEHQTRFISHRTVEEALTSEEPFCPTKGKKEMFFKELVLKCIPGA